MGGERRVGCGRGEESVRGDSRVVCFAFVMTCFLHKGDNKYFCTHCDR